MPRRAGDTSTRANLLARNRVASKWQIASCNISYDACLSAGEADHASDSVQCWSCCTADSQGYRARTYLSRDRSGKLATAAAALSIHTAVSATLTTLTTAPAAPPSTVDNPAAAPVAVSAMLSRFTKTPAAVSASRSRFTKTPAAVSASRSRFTKTPAGALATLAWTLPGAAVVSATVAGVAAGAAAVPESVARGLALAQVKFDEGCSPFGAIPGGKGRCYDPALAAIVARPVPTRIVARNPLGGDGRAEQPWGRDHDRCCQRSPQ